MTEENRAPPRHHCRPGCRMSADRALARHVGVAAFIVNNNLETMEGGPAICFPQPEVALPDASPSYEDGWAHAGSRLVTGPFAVVQHLTMSKSPWMGKTILPARFESSRRRLGARMANPSIVTIRSQ